MTRNEQIYKLKDALEKLTVVRDSLDGAATRCPHCGLQKYSNIDDWQTRQMLSAAIARTEKALNRLKGKGERDGNAIV